MTSAFRIEIRPSIHDSRRDVFLKKIREAGFEEVSEVEVVDVHTVNKKFEQDERLKISQMLINPIIETAEFSRPNAPEDFDSVLEIGFLPGVTDNVASTVMESIEDLMKLRFDFPQEAVYSSQLIFLKGEKNLRRAEEIALLFSNPLVNRIHVRSHSEFLEKGGMDTVIPKVDLRHAPKADEVDLDLNEADLLELGKKGILNEDGSRRGPLALRKTYLQAIQNYFKKEGRKPRDIELESIAQTWSEHCKHTIFADPLDELEAGIFKATIRKATEVIRAKKGKDDFCVSVFTDNAGAIVFDENYLVSDKAETHNSPSALDPFGGAITGIVGVNRDSLGFGMGSKPILNRYGFCVGDPDTAEVLYRDKELTQKALHPKTVLHGVVKGVSAGGNESGIPSPQGFVYFDRSYSGKPLVFAGTVGLIPRTVNGKDSTKKQAQTGDRIVMAGGRVGLDGIHGATFSSEALDSGSPSTAVQIGDPITQKKMMDVIVKEARDRGLYRSITDNGAGGLSCSVAEMAKECGGCLVQLDRVPLKYPNLAPWEIWISESQERMTFAVPPEKVEEFVTLLARRGVEATDIGEFTESGRCQVRWREELLLDLEMDFLHDGLPKEPQFSRTPVAVHQFPDFSEPRDYAATLLQMISAKNVGGFSWISKWFDHEVQGGSVIKPVQGKGRVNGTANVIRPLLDSNKAIVTSQGINPSYSVLDCYAMAAASIDDAVASAVAAGANVDHMAIMDNFCWCSSTEPERLGQLKAAARACFDTAVAYGTPYISGKDSMFNDFEGYDSQGNPLKVSALPTLLVSALSVIPDARHAMSLDFKQVGDLIYLIGQTENELGGSEYLRHLGLEGHQVPAVDTTKAYACYQAMFSAMQKSVFNSVTHVEKGGLGVALLKAAIAGQLGCELELSEALLGDLRPDEFLFSESKSRFLVSVDPSKQLEFAAAFPEAKFLGRVAAGDQIVIQKVAQLSLAEVTEAYHRVFKHY